MAAHQEVEEMCVPDKKETEPVAGNKEGANVLEGARTGGCLMCGGCQINGTCVLES